ncbi:MAG: tRNA (guanosine(46)-N7)-methyltransferase TrmB [Deltaproteobacteria bacterium]|nr:tRNA (guanosine(46)-N7)-methyltransferase TrmB [Deltaproteobacteria bacterium]
MSAPHNPRRESALVLEDRIAWPELFGREAPLELEIGCGYGYFLMERARALPGTDFVGLEIKNKLGLALQRKADRAGLTNLRAYVGDARIIVPTLFAPGSLRAVHIQFPDPWWKKRHHKRRLVDAMMVDLLHLALEESGRVYLRTDILDYGRAMVESFEDGSGRFENLHGEGRFALDDGLGIPSNRERRYLASGTPVYRLVYQRKPA